MHSNACLCLFVLHHASFFCHFHGENIFFLNYITFYHHCFIMLLAVKRPYKLFNPGNVNAGCKKLSWSKYKIENTEIKYVNHTHNYNINKIIDYKACYAFTFYEFWQTLLPKMTYIALYTFCFSSTLFCKFFSEQP